MKCFRFAIFMVFIFNILSAQNNMGGGGMDFSRQDFPCLTAEKRMEIQQQLDASIQDLLNRGIIESARTEQVTLMEWPVIGALGQTDYGYHGISNFVDQNSAFPNQLQDYNCGERTYDLASGYNHQGVDIFTWPFGWYRMDNDEIIIVAAAPGTIIFKASGNNDRSCGFNGSDWNAVYVQHSDGSVAWYGHMKKNSPTAKNVGETVVAGEYLGVVGSSGNSTGPHLHLEIHDAGGNLIEPFQGAFYGLTLVHFDFRQANQPSVLSVWLWGSTRVNSTTRRATPNVKSWRTPRQGTAVYQYTNYIYKAQQNRVFEAISGSCLLIL